MAANAMESPQLRTGNQKVYVIGVGMTKFYKPGSTDLDYPQLAQEAVGKALKDAQINYSQVEQACVGYVYGDSTCGQRALYEIGMTSIPVYNVNNNCATGSTALAMAQQFIKGNISDCVLALGFEKMAKGSLQSVFEDRTNPMDKHVELLSIIRDIEPAPMAPQLFGAAGREHMSKYNTKPEHFAKIAWKNHKHSVNNPLSQFTKEYTMQEIMDSAKVYDPLTRLQCCPTSDGAAAAILASEKFVREHGLENQAVEIVGLSMVTDPPSTFKDKSCIKIVGFDMTKRAAEDLYKNTGITPNDIDVIELHDCFSANELITYEALGLCKVGEAGQFIDSGNNTYGGKYVINPSGGLISKGHPLGATGLAQCAELCWQLRNKADKRQVKGAKIGLQHNLGLGGAVVLVLYKLGFPNSEASSFENKFACYPFFEKMRFIAETEKNLKIQVDGKILFRVTDGPDGKDGYWLITISNGCPQIVFYEFEQPADCVLTTSDSVLCDIGKGELDLRKSFFQGKVKFKGNVSLLMKLQSLQSFQSKL